MAQLKKIAYLLLRFVARQILRRYHPQIVAVTGSVGKSTTVEAIYRALSTSRSVRRSFGNYNSEWGIPATIIGKEFDGTTKGGFLKITLGGYLKVLAAGIQVGWGTKVDYPSVLVLEMAADHPGDIAYLLSFVQPQIGVVTNVGISHAEFFRSEKEILEEKILVLQSALKNGGVAVFNRDDTALASRAQALRGSQEKKLSFGRHKESKIRLMVFTEELEKTKVQIRLPQGEVKLLLPPGGKGVAYAALAALACGLIFGVKPEVMAEGLKHLVKPHHRMEIVRLSSLLLIDDSYNSAPASVENALSYLQNVGGQLRRRTVAILGAMRELGENSAKVHREMGALAANKAGVVIAFGGLEAKLIADGARETLARKKEGAIVEYLPESQKGRLLEILKRNDLVLVKASRSLQFEDKVVRFLKENDHRIK